MLFEWLFYMECVALFYSSYLEREVEWSSFQATWADRVALISVCVALIQTPIMQRDHRYRASTSRGVPVYITAFSSTKLYCLVTEAHQCEQLAQGCYPSVWWPAVELANIQVASPTTRLPSQDKE